MGKWAAGLAFFDDYLKRTSDGLVGADKLTHTAPLAVFKFEHG
jgi:hypothetical protein